MYRVLIIDDDATVRAEIRAALLASDLDVELYEAVDGAAGLKIALALGDVHFFVVDYNMPGLNGLETVGALLSHAAFAARPVMLYTTETNAELVAQARALSPSIKWVIKPLAPETFVLAVKGCLGLKPTKNA